MPYFQSMEFTYFSPSEILRPYVRHYYLFQSPQAVAFEDTVFPSGDMEMIFNLGEGTWATPLNTNPPIELWGQMTKPFAIRSIGPHTMLGVKFFPHSAAYFLDETIGDFNDRVSDLGAILGNAATHLHSRLLAIPQPAKRISLLESFLIGRLTRSEKSKSGRRSFRIDKVGHILKSMTCGPADGAETRINAVATQHGISSRYLNKLIYQHTGLTPVSFHKIRRFQFSLRLVARNDQPLTSIAYESGYFDQSHFIKEFKSFTGLTPSAYLKNISPVNQLLQQ
jgi:AraC-like DNA-binding protein